MTNKLVGIINTLKEPKIKKNLLYEMKFIVPNYSCLQNPWLGGYRPQTPFSLSFVRNWICWTPPSPRTKFLGTSLVLIPNITKITRLLWSKSFQYHEPTTDVVTFVNAKYTCMTLLKTESELFSLMQHFRHLLTAPSTSLMTKRRTLSWWRQRDALLQTVP